MHSGLGDTKVRNQMVAHGLPSAPSRANAHQMFDRISRRYDLLNHLLSLGLDFYWRRRAVGKLDRKPQQVILDLACGTGDLTLAAAQRQRESVVLGIDKAPNMLRIAAQKIAAGNSESIRLLLGDGLAIPVRDSSCDAAMIAFGIRNMPDTVACLQELHRVLNVGGKVIILEFSQPTSRVFRALHRFYLRRVVPVVGRLISGDGYAYSYLDQTIETYVHGESFCRLMKESGFVEIIAEPLSFGIVTIYTGRKL
jgi:demethylmenaquinone methyltransferase/2-methoxy-6-polyprenyl-1,4-benzoquinol methylase